VNVEPVVLVSREALVELEVLGGEVVLGDTGPCPVLIEVMESEHEVLFSFPQWWCFLQSSLVSDAEVSYSLMRFAPRKSLIGQHTTDVVANGGFNPWLALGVGRCV